jgi:hypothetical protein
MITFVCYRLQLNLSITGFIYLIVVVLQSQVSNFASSAVVSGCSSVSGLFLRASSFFF